MSNDQSPIDRMQREQILAERSSLALMQTGMNNVGLSEMRPNQEDDSVFLTPSSSPGYSDGGGYINDMNYFPQEQQEIVNLEQQSGSLGSLHSAVSTSYLSASPCDETYYHHGSPPYSPPYDNSPTSAIACSPIACSPGAVDICSSPGSCSGSANPYNIDLCSPPAISCTGPEQFPQYMTAIPTTSCTPLPFSCGVQDTKGTPCIYSPACYQPPTQWGEMMYPENFNLNVNIKPCDNPVCGEIPINVIDRQMSGSPDIRYYPPSPQPLMLDNGFGSKIGAVFPQTNGLYGSELAPMHQPFPMPSKIPSGEKQVTRRRKAKVSHKPPVEVDDSEIKDIPTSAQLWEFTLRVLKKPKYSNMISWENQAEGLFRFTDAQAFAALWGKHRNRPNMTYDKVARALRYYYKRNIFQQVGGRLTYRFSDRLRKLYQSKE